MAGCPSGQWEGTVNPPALPSKVQILHPPPHPSKAAIFLHIVRMSTSGTPSNNICNGHEFQHQAPANWTATLHRGGVLRVKTGLIATIIGKRGSN